MRKVVKTGSVFLSEETIAFILAAAGVIVIVYLMFQYIYLGYDGRAETEKAYFESLKRAINEADEYGISEMSPIAQAKEGEFYFLVYYGNKNAFPDFEFENTVKSSSMPGFGYNTGMYVTRHYTTDFFLKRITTNTICICSTAIKNEVLQKENYTREAGSFSQTDYFHYSYATKSVCNRCIDLKYPLDVRGSEPYVYNLNQYDFLIHKEKGDDKQSKYELEVIAKSG